MKRDKKSAPPPEEKTDLPEEPSVRKESLKK
jgi:hypothetical protein